MRSTSFAHLSVRLAEHKGLLAAAGVVIAAVVALVLGDSHSLGMMYD